MFCDFCVWLGWVWFGLFGFDLCLGLGLGLRLGGFLSDFVIFALGWVLALASNSLAKSLMLMPFALFSRS